MYKLLPFLGLVILFSCANEHGKTEKKLSQLMAVETLSIDLPDPPIFFDTQKEPLKVEVTANNKYVFNDEEYLFDELAQILDPLLDSNDRLKIDGHEMADYQAVFLLIEFSKQKDLKPILTFHED